METKAYTYDGYTNPGSWLTISISSPAWWARTAFRINQEGPAIVTVIRMYFPDDMARIDRHRHLRRFPDRASVVPYNPTTHHATLIPVFA